MGPVPSDLGGLRRSVGAANEELYLAISVRLCKVKRRI